MLQRRESDNDSVIFETEINIFRIQVLQHRWINQAVISAAVALPLIALAVPSTPRFIKGMSLGLGAIFGYASHSIAKMRENEEKIYSSYLEINKEQYKKSIVSELATAEIFQDITNQINLRKSMATLPPQAQLEYGEMYGIPQGLYADLFQSDEREPVSDVADTSYVVSGESGVRVATKVSNPLVAKYPEYIREGMMWIEELVESSTHPDMNKRYNHHLGIFGGTQDGKTTLCGLLVKMMTERVEASVICHDAKNTPGGKINNWMCEFTAKIDGYENTENWLELLDDYIQQQMAMASDVGGNLDSIPELIAIQDEANTAYGTGKGDGRYITARMANSLLSSWKFVITNLAGCKGHLILMGQSPLRGDIGISNSCRDNMCIITMGNSCNYVLDPKNRANFIRNPDKRMIQSLTVISQSLTKQGVRFALVIPTRGQPYIGLIPDIRKEAVGTSKTSPDEPREEPREEPPPHPDSNTDILESIRLWYKQCQNEGLEVDKEDIRTLWQKLTGELLTDVGLNYLMSLVIK